MGYKIKELREKKNMTQDELAEKSGVSRTIISFLENGNPNTTSKTLVRIARALDVTIDQLFYKENA